MQGTKKSVRQGYIISSLLNPGYFCFANSALEFLGSQVWDLITKVRLVIHMSNHILQVDDPLLSYFPIGSNNFVIVEIVVINNHTICLDTPP
jgi:hypothetical protein